MLLCPTCGNLLLIRLDDQGRQQFYCQACPYIYSFSSKLELKRKQVDDVLGGADAWKNVDSTDVTCPKCEHGRAYFMQIQIRSADEPSSIFYKCCNPECNHQWREETPKYNSEIDKGVVKGVMVPQMPDIRGVKSYADYEIIIEYKNLPNQIEFPAGLYLMPRENSIREFEGAYFVPAGPYKGSIVRILLYLPGDYPNGVPAVKVLSRFFHPLLDPKTKMLTVQDCHTMVETAKFISNCFDEMFLYGLGEEECVDREALMLLKTDRLGYDELLAECIQESVEFAKSCRTGMICLGAAQNSETLPTATTANFINKV